jgi:hypothetical protein
MTLSILEHVTATSKLKYPFGRPPEGTDVLWRVDGKRYSVVIDADREEYGSTPLQVEMRWYHVTKRTPCGAWLGSRFVRLNARKQFASNTEKEALESYIARKKRQIGILSAQLREAERGLKIAEHTLNTGSSCRSPG